jgi:hypothetical protein
MRCPPEIMDIILEILNNGILRVRSAGWSGDSDRCAIEADHVHNLPCLLADYSPDLLRFYWESARVSFIDQSAPSAIAPFEPLWSRLAPFAMGLKEQALTT